MFSWPRFYPRTMLLEYLLENALHRGASNVDFGGQDCHTRVFKLASPERNNCITSVSYFLQPRLCLLLTTHGRFVIVADGLMSIGHTLSPVPKAPYVLKDLSSLCTVPVDFHIWYPRQMNLPSITGMSIIVPSPTNIQEPLKSFNRLAMSHSVPCSRDNTYSVWFKKHCPELLTANAP